MKPFIIQGKEGYLVSINPDNVCAVRLTETREWCNRPWEVEIQATVDSSCFVYTFKTKEKALELWDNYHKHIDDCLREMYGSLYVDQRGEKNASN